MKPWAKETLRWTAVVLAGGVALWLTFVLCHDFLKGPGIAWNDWRDWGTWFLIVLFFAIGSVITLPFYLVAWYCLRREYRKIFHVLAVVGSVVVFGLIDLPFRRQIMNYFGPDHVEAHPGLALLGLPLALLLIFGPFWAAAWFYHWCNRFAQPRA